MFKKKSDSMQGLVLLKANGSSLAIADQRQLCG
jgi:hypothetical protein